jgi:MtN3 and saliva related transmembrane protein
MITVLGLAAGALSSMSLLPQVVRSVRTGRTTDLSWAWLALFAASVTGWLVYGLLIRDPAVTATNAVMVGLIGLLLSVKARHTWRAR